MRITDYETTGQSIDADPRQDGHVSKPSSALVATRLVAALKTSSKPCCYVALGEGAAEAIANAVRHLFPDIEPIVLPPWDCLPYDRVPPSRHSMGRRMDALRVWSERRDQPRLLVTSLDAILQRLPPARIIANSRFELAVGQPFDRDAFETFVRHAGYMEEGVADEPGEFACREDVIDIFPAGGSFPMRIILSDQETVKELRSYDPKTQRTDRSMDHMVFGPASEVVVADVEPSLADRSAQSIERSLLCSYGTMQSIFDILGDARIFCASGSQQRAEEYLDIIDDARQAFETFKKEGSENRRSIYLGRREWRQQSAVFDPIEPELVDWHELPFANPGSGQNKDVRHFVQQSLQAGCKVLVCGQNAAFIRRLERDNDATAMRIDTLEDISDSSCGQLLELDLVLDRGFVDEAARVVWIAAPPGAGAHATDEDNFLGEPELQIGDVVVHEAHGVGVLTKLERVEIDGTTRDTARLQYHDDASLLVPMEEFGKLWRYGSEPEAVALDHLHTDNWKKKQARIAKDIRLAARHLLAIAKERSATVAKSLVPPRSAYAAFVRRFPYALTADQDKAIRAVLADLSSHRPMNRLVCGDVGYGKTEVALRAAAAVALSGGQVVIIAPTTVLARQHFATFNRRFAGSGIKVAMLSRLVKSVEANRIKTEISDGDIDIVVATQAILAKDVTFARLALLIVDEEHRFGLKDKQSMAELSPSLHVLSMSATPIPRTLKSAMIGVQEVSLLLTPPSKRRPVRTSLSVFDRAAMRGALMREFRRGGQSFVVVPRIEDIGEAEAILHEIVPEFKITIAHGRMPPAEIEDAVVGFAEGEGDVLLSTNIIESGLDVPRANTIFIWRADRFGLSQLHQLRGRVGRARAQGIAYLLTLEGDDLSDETRLRLATLVDNDRLGSGLAISMRDLDLRGGGDLLGKDQAGHMKMIGVSLYQTLLERAVLKLRGQDEAGRRRAIVNLGVTGTLSPDYVPDPAVRLNIYARLMRATSIREIDDLEEELEDRFGDLAQDASILLKIARLQIAATGLGIAKLDAGPKALALSWASTAAAKPARSWAKYGATRRGNRLLFDQSPQSVAARIAFFEKLLSVR